MRRTRWIWALALGCLLGVEGKADSLWLGQAKFPQPARLVLLAHPFDRSTLVDLDQERFEASVDSRPARVLGVSPLATVGQLGVLIDHTQEIQAEAKLWNRILKEWLENLPQPSEIEHSLFLSDRTRLQAGGPRAVLAGVQETPLAPGPARWDEVLPSWLKSFDPPRPLAIWIASGKDAPSTTDPDRLVELAGSYGAPLFFFSYGTEVDRSLLRRLAQASGGQVSHSFRIRNLRKALLRFLRGFGLRRVLELENPFPDEWAQVRTVALTGSRRGRPLGQVRLDFPGRAQAPLPPHPSPPPNQAPPPPVALPRSPAAPPASAKIPAPPRFELGPLKLSNPSEPLSEKASQLRVLFRLVESHAGASLNPSLGLLAKRRHHRPKEELKAIYRRARIALAFVGNTYGKNLRQAEAQLETWAANSEVSSAEESQLRGLIDSAQQNFEAFKADLKAWGRGIGAPSW